MFFSENPFLQNCFCLRWMIFHVIAAPAWPEVSKRSTILFNNSVAEKIVNEYLELSKIKSIE